MECFHMTSRRPYWCPKTMKRRPCWCPKPVLWELNSFLMQTLSFVPINLHICWPREWKHSINWPQLKTQISFPLPREKRRSQLRGCEQRRLFEDKRKQAMLFKWLLLTIQSFSARRQSLDPIQKCPEKLFLGLRCLKFTMTVWQQR